MRIRLSLLCLITPFVCQPGCTSHSEAGDAGADGSDKDFDSDDDCFDNGLCGGEFCRDAGIYYFDPCDYSEELIQKCDDDEICREIGTTAECCRVNAYKQCFSAAEEPAESAIYWFDECGFPVELFGFCEDPSGTCVNVGDDSYKCTCNNHWEGENCEICPGNWDPEQDCDRCRGNWNRNEDCEVCLTHWIDEDNDCGTCPDYWDPESNCDKCIPPYGGYNCDKYCVKYVDIDATAGGNGMDWERGYHNVQDALDWAADKLAADFTYSECEVWVAEGTYYIYQSSEYDTVELKENVSLLGGFAGDETSVDERNWVEHPVILDGHDRANGEKRVYHVVTGNDHALIDGLIITGGYAASGSVGDSGGGMFNSGGLLTIRNCIFRDNHAVRRGGAIASFNCSATIINSVFYNNHAEEGGAIANRGGSDSNIVNCTLIDNTADSGGAIHNYTSTSHVFNSILWANTPDVVYNDLNADAEFEYSCVEDISISDNNINEDPMFAGMSSGDFHLLPDSPCIDIGDDDKAPERDFEKRSRVDIPDAGAYGTVSDMGAYEYQP